MDKAIRDILDTLPPNKRGSYSTTEVSNILNCGKTFVLERLKTGELEGGRLGFHWRITPTQLATFIHKQQTVDPLAGLKRQWKSTRRIMGREDTDLSWVVSPTYLEFTALVAEATEGDES